MHDNFCSTSQQSKNLGIKNALWHCGVKLSNKMLSLTAATFPWVFVKTDITHDAQHCCLACITLIFWVAINIRINCTKAKLVRASVPSLLWLPRQLSDRQA